MRRTNVIHCEVEFAPIYRDQPMFSEVEAFLRAGGFEFIDFTASCRYTYEKTSSRRAERLGWADAVFFRSGAVGDNALAQAAIAAHVYGKHGLAEMVLTAA